MKAHAIETRSALRAAATWRGESSGIASGLLAQARGLELVAMLATRLALALLPALGVLVMAALALSDPDLERYLQLTLWTGGFLFYALAIDAEKPGIASLLALSGLIVQSLAWLSAGLAPELALAGAVIIATWLAIGVARGLLRRD
jgi:hypothetical protein